jgi:hypothetical protein
MKKQSRTDHQQYMYEKIEQWKKSDLTQKRFCEENKIARSCFLYWQKKYNQQLQGPSAFVPIVIQPGKNTTGHIEIHYPNGVRLQLPSGIAPSRVGEFIRMY